MIRAILAFPLRAAAYSVMIVAFIVASISMFLAHVVGMIDPSRGPDDEE